MITIEDTRNLIVHYTESDLDYNSYNFENNETLKDCFGYWILYDSETHSAIVLLGLYEQNQQLETEITRELLESDKYLDVFFYYLSRIEYNYSIHEFYRIFHSFESNEFILERDLYDCNEQQQELSYYRFTCDFESNVLKFLHYFL